MVVVDTPENADFLARFTHRGRKHFAVLWVGADESIYGPPAADPGDDAPILWYLTYIPLHGFETVARAAALLGDDGRRIRLVGDGQERAAAERLIAELGLQNLDVVGSVPEAELVDEIARARRSVSACSARPTRPLVSYRTRCTSARLPAARSSLRQRPRTARPSATRSSRFLPATRPRSRMRYEVYADRRGSRRANGRGAPSSNGSPKPHSRKTSRDILADLVASKRPKRP